MPTEKRLGLKVSGRIVQSLIADAEVWGRNAVVRVVHMIPWRWDDASTTGSIDEVRFEVEVWGQERCPT